MKKILHIQVLPKLSGVQRVSLEIFRGLSNNEYQKFILFSRSTEVGDMEECVKQFEEAGVEVLFSDNLKREIGLSDMSAFWEIYKLCKQQKFDIVHTHSTKPGIIGRTAAWFAKVPLIIHTVHGLSFHKFIKFPLWQFYWFCEMLSSLFCDKITIVNKYYVKYFKWFKKKTSTIYNGIDFSKLKRESYSRSTKDSIKILYVGRLDIPKDPLTMLQAAKIVCSKYPQVIFSIVGDGEKYEECNSFIISNNLQERVLLEGWQSDVSQYYASHDLFVMSSIYESFGLIFLEAGFYGLPVVATNVEGIPEVIEDGITGFLSEPLNFKDLAENILKLLGDNDLRLKMGKAAYDRVTTQFSVDKMIKEYEKIYHSL